MVLLELNELGLGKLANKYQKQVESYLGDKKTALKFFSGMVAAMDRIPELRKCTPSSLINSFIMMAECGFMPSGVSGEAYVLPYNVKGTMTAQFQLGYQGIVTLLYGAGAISVVSEIVRKNDKISILNGSVAHDVDPFKTKEERGEAIGAYSIITLSTGGKIEKFMRKEDILEMGKRFSKSWNSEYSPWKEKNDPNLCMWTKTVLKQAQKLAPKNEKLNKAIAEDNKDSDIEERMEAAKLETESMKMKALTKGQEETEEIKTENNEETKTVEGKTLKIRKKAEPTSDDLPEIQIDGGGEEE
jgi:recombination protein RecT